MKLIKLFLLLLPILLTAKESTVEQLFNVQTIKAKSIQTSHTKKAYAYVKPDDERVYHVTPRYSGFVIKVHANKIYQYVKKGEPLVTLYSPEVYKAKEEYINSYNYTKGRDNKGMLESAKLKLQLLGISNKEIKSLLKSKTVSQNTTIYSPVSGYIFIKNITNGSAFNAKSMLYEIVNLDKVWLEAKIFEEDISWIKNANSFEVAFKSTNKLYTTNKMFLYPNLDPKEASVTMRLVLNNKEHQLFPGMYATIIIKDKKQTYLTLPSTAVIRKNATHYVFISGEYEGEYEPKEVHVKALNNETYIIVDGLTEGDEVVNNALFMMDSDAQINGLY
ncbi:HlyD family efflux transporter periplasmic adaptor subunit [Sulfurimonas aquatica]|uniref:HlyD family efflux transporter periplasmic adaptor subunit n=1 Tax=Sulfurimonas aquatica TaxID=2672570 RepID=A0A975GDL8_9BACT|nr:efflux RND transporter periplasmic adaptor subunit [Sulfurimonas aquatica]QSZ42861.1 HlyD family efflux transporter periplasmic adaptor subunit [Sulfurimonas aquatica]